MQYRREIDGLRTIAVIPVILFHAGFEIFSGGFVGVDIFFVISGYLITSIIIRELDAGDFSILRFYERRARRILPALFLVMLVTLPFSWAWMMPAQFSEYAASLIAVALFASNILFWRESGYFGAAAEEKPLLHTWSLAVEEQYYMLFPIFLILFWRFGRQPVFYMILAITAVSLALSEWGWRNSPQGNFYLAPTRVWELLAGSICAFLQFKTPQKSNNLLAAVGFGMVLYAIFMFTEETPFPSVYALVPVVGTALIVLYADGPTWVGRLLSTPPFVGIGLISYSAYLWHQPLFAFARIRSITVPDSWLMMSLAVLSLVLAYLSWRFIERPFRLKPPAGALPTQTGVFIASGIGMAAFMMFGAWGYLGNGLPQRLPANVVAAAGFEADKNAYQTRCHYKINMAGRHNIPALPFAPCVFPKGAGSPEVAILGDSHGDALAQPVLERLVEGGFSATQITMTACNPFPGFWISGMRCDVGNDYIQTWLSESDVRTVVLIVRYSATMYRETFDNTEGGVEKGHFAANTFLEGPCDTAKAGAPETCQEENAFHLFENGIKSYLEAGLNVVLLYPVPEAGWSVPKTYAKVIMQQDAESLSTPKAAFDARYGKLMARLDRREHPRLARVRPSETLCDTYLPERCINALGDQVFYFDDDHLSNTGAALIAPQVVEAVHRLNPR